MRRDEILRELMSCQQRVNELEKLKDKQQEELLQARAAFATVFESAPDALVVVDRRGRITQINAQAEKLFGYPRDELIGEDHGILVPDRAKEIHADEMRSYMDKPRLRTMGIGLELYGRRKDGSVFPADIDLGPLERADGLFVLGVVRDVTVRKKLEEDLAKSEERFRRTLDNMMEGCQMIDFDWRYLYLNNAAATHGRRRREEFLGRTLLEMYPGIEHTEIFSRLRECMEKRAPIRIENEFTFPDGTTGWFELSIQPVPEGVFILSMDITERKKLEEELKSYHRRLEEVVAERTAEFARANAKLVQTMEEHRKTEEGLLLRSTILDNAGDPIFVFNQKFDFVYANEAACRAYGYSREEFLSMNLRRLLSPQDVPLIESRLTEVMDTGRVELNTVHVRKDGSQMPVQVRHTKIKTLHGQFIVSVMHDLREE